MLRLLPIYSPQGPARWKSGGSALLATLVLLSIFSPLITWVAFHWHLEEHLVECQHERHHDDDCLASCILTEMMPESTEALAEQTTYVPYFFPVWFFQHSSLFLEAPPESASVVHGFFYLVHESPPGASIPTPPPQFL